MPPTIITFPIKTSPEECDKEDDVAVTGAATASCFEEKKI